MSKIFISHASANSPAALALACWLEQNGWGEYFLDIAATQGLAPGERWQRALKTAADRCEAVLIIVSPSWRDSRWCLAEFLLAKQLGKTVTTSNISYLIQYGRIRKFGNDGTTQVSKQELISYYKSYNGYRELSWKDQLGEDLNWALSFDQYKEAETTKHVHRLHPYKGKFIPQLVEYFLDNHTDKTGYAYNSKSPLLPKISRYCLKR